jgi:hypothetical protein
MYYGNAGASSTSSFDGTFIFGDTFESASLNTARWPSIDPGITYTIDAINKYLECTDNYTRGSIRLIHGKAINIGTGNFRIEAAYGAAGFGAYIGKIAANYVGRAYLFLGISGNDQTFTLYEIDAWDGTQVSQAFAATPAGNWNSGDHAEPATSYFIAHRVGMGANQTKVYVNGVNVVSGISTSNIISCHLGFFKSSVYSQLPERIYNFKIRNYTTNEPSWSEFGSEETTLSVYHVILSAVYSEESPEVNRVFVVGTDTAGGQVSGSAVTQAEVDLVGERMEAHHDPAIPSGMVAAAVAAAMLEKAGLDGHRAELVIPPHCGLELWDVLAVIDTVANQDALYRVIGYQFEYDTVKGIYLQRLKLCAV